MARLTLVGIAAVLLLGLPLTHAAEKEFTKHLGFLPGGPQITTEDITEEQKLWGDAVVAIGEAGDEAETVAEEAARTAYAFHLGPIQFKPTLASETPFRQDVEGALSYFVGGNDKFKEDKGFALRPWIKVRFVNDTVKIKGNIAIAMGHYYFTDAADDKETKVEYTKGYVKTQDGRVLIFLQDSSLPYSPPSADENVALTGDKVADSASAAGSSLVGVLHLIIAIVCILLV